MRFVVGCLMKKFWEDNSFSISVMPGDVINMEVWAKYFDAPATPQNSPLRDFILYLGSMGRVLAARSSTAAPEISEP